MHRFLICALVTRDFFLSDIYLLPVISRARFASLYSQHIGSALKQHALHVSVWVRVETNTFLLYCYMPSRDVLGVVGVSASLRPVRCSFAILYYVQFLLLVSCTFFIAALFFYHLL